MDKILSLENINAKNLSPIKARILEFLDFKKEEKKKFFEGIGASPSNFRSSGLKSEAGGDVIAKILSKYPELNPDWLTTGKGQMIRSNIADAVMVDATLLSTMYVPLVNQYAYAGYMSGYGDPEYLDELPKVAWAGEKEYKGEYVCFEVKGDSMDDGSDQALKEHDLILCRNVRKDYWTSKLHIQKWDFVIVHREKGICVKRISKHDVENGVLTLHSLNEMFDDFDVNLSDVDQIFNVVDWKRKRKR